MGTLILRIERFRFYQLHLWNNISVSGIRGWELKNKAREM
jgi:hypothetical protein